MPAQSGTSSPSMHTSTSLRSSWLSSSPSRQSPSRPSPSRPSPSRNGARNRRDTQDVDVIESPSRKMLLEFNVLLERSDSDFHSKLNQEQAERAKSQDEELALAVKEHMRVQQGGHLEIERIVLEHEHEKLRREEAQRREIERLKQEKAKYEAEAHQRQLEAKKKEEEAARLAAEQRKQLQEADARIQAQKQREEAERNQAMAREAVERKAREAAAAAPAAIPTAAPATVAPTPAQRPPQPTPAPAAPTAPSQPAAVAAVAPSTTSPGIEEIHAKYLELHGRMKQFRIAFENEQKRKDNPLKAIIGDARRNMRLRMGQITKERESSKQAIARLRDECFTLALNTPGPTVDIRPYIVSHEYPPLSSDADAQYPAFLLYVWMRFVKALLKQFEKEAANDDGLIIQEIGLIAASLLTDSRYFWNGVSMTDLVLAKYHKLNPILFGIRGTMSTAQGRQRLGWLHIDKADPTPNSYAQRMRGLSAGYASLSLRQFTGKPPAIPVSEYWRAVARVCNTPTNLLTAGHFAVLQGLIQHSVKKFITFYGVSAKAALRRAVYDLPARAPQDVSESANLVKVLPDGWRVRERISI
ncbi:hypothetical protein BS50DRAFT_172466 [Corynespora cassiicola Philippines]|uniref:mRNA export factor GLE1 n=1 Tax=Corynespora cassiicola Philippines TaxID=1448308 RepID=A0A2T2P5X4_CORCC|nr:hypothetical protein BS50DRAFT_172466 [Corynespora cassiicola Philippines]